MCSGWIEMGLHCDVSNFKPTHSETSRDDQAPNIAAYLHP